MYYLIKPESFKGGGKEKRNKKTNSFHIITAIKKNLELPKV